MRPARYLSNIQLSNSRVFIFLFPHLAFFLNFQLFYMTHAFYHDILTESTKKGYFYYQRLFAIIGK